MGFDPESNFKEKKDNIKRLSDKIRLNDSTGDSGLVFQKMTKISSGWLHRDDALMLLVPTFFGTPEEGLDFLMSKNIDRAKLIRHNKSETNVFYTPSIMLFIAKMNGRRFDKVCKEKSEKSVFTEGGGGWVMSRKNKTVSRLSPNLFNKMSMYTMSRDFNVETSDSDALPMRPYDTFKSVYSLIMFNDFFTSHIKNELGLRAWQLRTIIGAVSFRYFTKSDFSNLNTGAKGVSYVRAFEFMIHNGYIKLWRKHDRLESKDMYVVTDKAIGVVKYYSDVIMFKKKISVKSDSPTPYFDINAISSTVISPNKASHYFRTYALYSYVYEWVNLETVENRMGYSDSELSFFFNQKNNDLKYSAYTYLVANRLYATGRMTPKSVRFVKAFLTNDIFGDSGYRFKFKNNTKRKELVYLKTKQTHQAQELLDDFLDMTERSAELENNKAKGESEDVILYFLQRKLKGRLISMKINDVKRQNGIPLTYKDKLYGAEDSSEDENLFVN